MHIAKVQIKTAIGCEDRKLHVANLYKLDGSLLHTLDHGSLVGRAGICRLPRLGSRQLYVHATVMNISHRPVAYVPDID